MAVRVGGIGIVGLPGEIFYEHGLEIKKRSPAAHTMVVELANDAIGYVPTREAFGRGYGVLQVVYNLIDTRAEAAVFPTARRYNLGVLARVPLASGLLSGRHELGVVFGPDDFRSTLGRDEIKRRIREADKLVDGELPVGISRVRWALAWCLRDPVVTAVIPGVKDPEQVAENASAADLLSEKTP